MQEVPTSGASRPPPSFKAHFHYHVIVLDAVSLRAKPFLGGWGSSCMMGQSRHPFIYIRGEH